MTTPISLTTPINFTAPVLALKRQSTPVHAEHNYINKVHVYVKQQSTQLFKMFTIYSFRGWCQLNLSIATFKFTRMSQCTAKSINPASRRVVMDDQKAVLIHFRLDLLKDCSAKQLVTGRVHSILTNALMFGYIEVACLRITAGLDGKLPHPCSLRD